MNNVTEEIEKALASFAAFSKTSLGRLHQEQEHAFRTPFTRDRDRVVHSSAFRRLESKTQVFSYFENDYYRTRLTHTIEVAQITRTLTSLLGLNTELAEAVALSHDLGHPPFGHAGERALAGFLEDYSEETDGYVFNHNIQGLRIVEFLENKYPDYLGLNLTFEVREAFAKHGSGRDHTPAIYAVSGSEPSLEAQIADLSDAIAYNAHDIDDGLLSGLIVWEELVDVPFVAEFVAKSTHSYRDDPVLIRNELIRSMINYFVTDAWETTKQNIHESQVTSIDDVRRFGKSIAGISDEATEYLRAIRSFLWDNLYTHPKVLRTSTKATHIILSLCKAMKENPDLLPREWSVKGDSRLPAVHDAIRVADFVSSLTDSSAVELYKQLFDPSHGIHR